MYVYNINMYVYIYSYILGAAALAAATKGGSWWWRGSHGKDQGYGDGDVRGSQEAVDVVSEIEKEVVIEGKKEVEGGKIEGENEEEKEGDVAIEEGTKLEIFIDTGGEEVVTEEEGKEGEKEVEKKGEKGVEKEVEKVVVKKGEREGEKVEKEGDKGGLGEDEDILRVEKVENKAELSPLRSPSFILLIPGVDLGTFINNNNNHNNLLTSRP
jgi:hypothetical protein